MPDRALLREILDAQLEMVCRFRADGTILFVNRAYARSLNREPDELTGQNLWSFIPGDDRQHVRTQLDRLTPDQPELKIENRFDTATGPRWVLWSNHALEFDEAGKCAVGQSTGIDITERKQLEEQLELLVGELNHRVKNSLMVVQAMAFQTFRGEHANSEPVVAFTQRLRAVSGAHDALSRSNWTGTTMSEIVRQGVIICDDGRSRVKTGGPEVVLPTNATVSLVMVLHELATNAMKYGALSDENGHITVHWAKDMPARELTIEWQEVGGPPVSEPSRKGFGFRLINEAVPRQLSGKVDLVYEPDGLRCRISLPLSGQVQ